MVGKFVEMITGSGGKATDPVCGMSVDMKNPPGGTFEHAGTTYYFCWRGCFLEFSEDPEGYLSGKKKMSM